MSSFRIALCLLSLTVMAVLSSPARAEWGDLYCDLLDDPDGTGLTEAVNLYNRDDPSERGCLKAVRFFEPGTISLSEGLRIAAEPPSGQSYGFAIRKCVSGGSSLEEGCPAMSASDVVLDVSGYDHDEGDCPIKIDFGARVDLIGFKVIAANKDKAICTALGVPIAPEDAQSEYAWIHNVIVCSSDNPDCEKTVSRPHKYLHPRSWFFWMSLAQP